MKSRGADACDEEPEHSGIIGILHRYDIRPREPPRNAQRIESIECARPRIRRMERRVADALRGVRSATQNDNMRLTELPSIGKDALACR